MAKKSSGVHSNRNKFFIKGEGMRASVITTAGHGEMPKMASAPDGEVVDEDREFVFRRPEA